MKHLIEYSLENGTSIFVEIDDKETESGLQRASLNPGEISEKAKQTFEMALERIKPAANTIVSKLRGLSDPPDEMEVEFGLKMSAEAGAVVASTGVEANYKVTLKWKRN